MFQSLTSRFTLLRWVWLLIILTGCQSGRTITFLHINDVYEIAPLDNGKAGGLARVAYLNKQLKKENPKGTFFVLAGDFLSPSVTGTLRYEGERIKGRQMVDVLNAAGLDLATFGNHEFDYDDDAPSTLNQRIEESKFRWVIANMQLRQGNKAVPFSKDGANFPTSLVLDNGKVRVGIFGICIPVNKEYVQVTDPFDAARREYEDLKNRCDAVVALTHLDVVDDQRMAEQIPGLTLIMGGHDHDHMQLKVGSTVVAKADANAKTVYIHRLHFNRKNQLINLESELKTIDETTPEDPATAALVTKWQTIANESFREQGFDPNEVVYTTPEPWDGLEATVRREHGTLTTLIAESMFQAFPGSDLAVFNGGSVRVDDVLEGPISQYDIVRILPFGGGIKQVNMTGDLLHKVLEAGRLSRGKGGFLHHANVRYADDSRTWYIAGQPLDQTRTYQVVLPEFLLTGKEFGMSFLIPAHPGIIQPIFTPAPDDPRSDVRKVFIDYLRKK
ncbi:bifunctional metallophosphatase/5'-nucleotidase [Persicitalea jodogahamensis]|uniref:Bifunctional metallophosphatase/5'-nucleotidase n=1 Tax=Persicitalea jodogahamensis TaxID=402147 RepID=A0A8J3DAL2_9BACT|nr:bifunctional metallophosphatase/5'-nucleotidase [Persicitalea jodogahamensis]GHB69285.1 bifunctional metallophosphatase/5'-nucleotidase [Persicitalea jodogahamensis]